jgi:uncharacterized repeat protein (TIGR01451 family)
LFSYLFTTGKHAGIFFKSLLGGFEMAAFRKLIWLVALLALLASFLYSVPLAASADGIAKFNDTAIQVKIVTIPAATGNVTFGGVTRFDGDTVNAVSGNYDIVAHPGEGYKFSYWQATPPLEVKDFTSGNTTLAVGNKGTLIMAQVPDTLSQKWLQRPNLFDYGIDVVLYNYDQDHVQMNDDFICRETGNLTCISLWGAWHFIPMGGSPSPTGSPSPKDSPGPPVSANFTLEIWSDDDYGVPLWTGNFSAGEAPGQYRASSYYSESEELLFDPSDRYQFDQFEAMDVWQYDFTLDPANGFIQQKGRIYWLVVKATYIGEVYDENPREFFLGLKNSLDNWGYDARWTDTEDWSNVYDLHYPDSYYVGGDEGESPIPYAGDSMDLAFALYGQPQPAPKWLQKPVTNEYGVDVYMPKEHERQLADDFLCDETGPITGISTWGSWKSDILPRSLEFNLGIWSDIPASVTGEYSTPGEELWSANFTQGEYEASLYELDTDELFWDPSETYSNGSDTKVWRYDFSIDPSMAFIQHKGQTYWLVVMVDYRGGPASPANGSGPGALGWNGPYTAFGWKNSLNHWNDDAVWRDWIPDDGGDWGDWDELRYPFPNKAPAPGYPSPEPGDSMDLAFALYGRPQGVPNVYDPKTVELAVDADSSGGVSPGDTLRYTNVIINSGNATAYDVMFSDSPDANTRLVVGSVLPSQGTVMTGNTTGDTMVVVNLGSIAPAASANVTFLATIKNPIYVSRVANQAIVTGSNFDPVNSDDPGTLTTDDPTLTDVQGTSIRQGVGGEVEMVDRFKVVLPWLPAALVIVAMGVAWRLARRRTG